MDEQGTRATEKNREIDKTRPGPRQGSDWAGTAGGMPGEKMGEGVTGTVERAETSANTSMERVREQARSTVQNLGEQARAAMADPGATAQELARRTREQASMATDALYQQGTRAGEYLSRNVNEYPLAALLIAGAVGYGLAYLIHTQWQSSNWQGSNWPD
jgi:ElaB/YqjD/DUF883 family membrane-anchored ribosome-binding protein